MTDTAEALRLASAYADSKAKPWLRWGPYLSERQWGTVREDYSAGGGAWDYFPHDQARSRAYRWGEDGLAGLSDDGLDLCFALSLWNGNDPILKERLFGLTNSEGNHGEDVKEYYFFLDSTPSHSFMRWLYKYPQRAFPYQDLLDTNAQRKATEPGAFEYELLDTGIFDDDRYFDVEVCYAKADTDDICIRIAVSNRGPDAARIDLLPTLWFRNRWSWETAAAKPSLSGSESAGVARIDAKPVDGQGAPMALFAKGADSLLFCDNETNNARLWASDDSPAFPKDGINDHVVHGAESVNPAQTGTKAAARWTLEVAAGATETVELRLRNANAKAKPFAASFAKTFKDRQQEADEFWASVAPKGISDDRAAIMRQAYAGMLWSKQYYAYDVARWLAGDPTQPAPPPERNRNADWPHLVADDILTMPDSWEYPWFAAWDLCFQTVVFSRFDADFTKNQILTLCREWYMSPKGAIPAYEWNFGDTNPPLQAWAALQIVDIEVQRGRDADLDFLEEVFRHGLMYFTWWANLEDVNGNDMFGGGFLGLDNISILNRSDIESVSQQVGAALKLLQSDGTSWMGLFSLNLMEISLRLAQAGRAGYDQLAVRFLQNFVTIADSINGVHRDGNMAIWNEEDGYYYDILHVEGGGGAVDQYLPVRLRSLVGVIALFPALSIDLKALPHGIASDMSDRLQELMDRHPQLFDQAMEQGDDQLLLSFVSRDRLTRILRRVLDENELLGPHGIRGLSAAHREPYTMLVNGHPLSERYAPAESPNQDFGGNSNWRGPVWFPINFLFIETLRRYHAFYGDDFTIAYPSGSDAQHTLAEIADDLSRRMVATFERDENGQRPVYGGSDVFQSNPHWRDHLLFYEYFHGDNGAGVGASHQTGWTGLVAELIQQLPVK